MDAKRLEEVAIEGGEKLCDKSARYRHCQRYQDKEESAKQKRSRSEAGAAMANEQETGVQSFGCSRKTEQQGKEDQKGNKKSHRESSRKSKNQREITDDRGFYLRPGNRFKTEEDGKL